MYYQSCINTYWNHIYFVILLFVTVRIIYINVCLIAQIHAKILNEFHLNTQFNKKDFYFSQFNTKKTQYFSPISRKWCFSNKADKSLHIDILISHFIVGSIVSQYFKKLSTYRPSLKYILFVHGPSVYRLNFDFWRFYHFR